MKNQLVLLFITALFASCNCSEKPIDEVQVSTEKEQINIVLDSWHLNAAETNFDAYFDAMSNKSVFVGTDAAEGTIISKTLVVGQRSFSTST